MKIDHDLAQEAAKDALTTVVNERDELLVQLATLRSALEEEIMPAYSALCLEVGRGDYRVIEVARAALATDAGAEMLAELEDLRARDAAARRLAEAASHTIEAYPWHGCGDMDELEGALRDYHDTGVIAKTPDNSVAMTPVSYKKPG